EVMGDLAGALYEQGRFAEACSLYEDAVRLCDHALEPGAFVGTDASIGWGRSLEALGQKTRADSVLRAVVAFRRMNPHQWRGRLAESDAAWGVCLARSGHVREGRRLLLASLADLRRDPVAPRSLLEDVRKSLST